MVVELIDGEKVDRTTVYAALGIARAINDAGKAGMEDRARTHGAGFERDEKLATGQTVIAQMARGIAQGDDFGMGGRIIFADGHVKAAPDDLAVVHDHGAHRHFTQALGGARLGNGFAHKKIVVHHRILS